GEPYFFKPPLNFWITAAFFHIFPMNAFTASLGSALFGALTALMVYLLCRVMFPGWRLAFAATLVFLTTHEVLHWTRGVHLETVLTFWTMAGLLAAYLSVKNPLATVGLGIAAGLGWLAKGPQCLYPGGVALVFWQTEGVLWRRLFSIWSVATGALLAALLAPWFWVRLQEGSGFGQGYFVKELGHTLFGPTQLHNGPLFYPVTLLATYWPWLPFALFGFFLLAGGWRRSSGARLWLIFAAVLTTVIMVTAERRGRYLFQLYPALSVAAGAAVVFAAERYPRVLRGLVILSIMGACGLMIFGRKNTLRSAPTRDALAVALRLEPGDQVRLTERTGRGGKSDPSVGKILGFYARPLLKTCASLCEKEAAPGSLVIARADEAEEVAARLKGRVDFANKTLAIVKVP
ncbi:MAG TPA: glycosyltransferase family 39 protein, partial [Candidatus Binatia bacterium]